MIFRNVAMLACMLIVVAPLGVSAASAQTYNFLSAPQTDLNRVYRINRFTGEMGACQYAIRDGTVGVALCYPAGEGAGAQSTTGDFDLVRSNHEREGGIFRVNRLTGEVSVCYVLSERVVCTPPAG